MPWLLLTSAVLAACAVVASGLGTRFDLWGYRDAFQILRWSAYAGFAVATLAVVVVAVPRWRVRGIVPLVLAIVVGVGAGGLPLFWLNRVRAVPPINDITTDTSNPPVFVAILPLRAKAPTPATYPGEAVAAQQRAGYPDLTSLTLSDPPAAAFERALSVARRMGWEIVAADGSAGRIEATATTPWFGFKDDIVVRVAADRTGSRIDIRSVSRVGRSDLGANARRIREFTVQFAR